MTVVSAFPGPGQSSQSRRAWWHAQEKMPARIARVYQYAVRLGATGITGDEAERGCSIMHQSMGSILLELRHAGLLVERGTGRAHERPTAMGKQMAQVYVAVPFGQHRPIPMAVKVTLRDVAKRVIERLDAGDKVGFRAAIDDLRVMVKEKE